MKKKQHKICEKFLLNNNNRGNHNLALAVNAQQAKGKLSSCSSQKPKHQFPFLESPKRLSYHLPWRTHNAVEFTAVAALIFVYQFGESSLH